MNRILLSILVFFFITFISIGQQVPSRLDFADMDLRLTNDAIKDIQADVDALTRSETYFQKKLERVDMYMPIIERIFREEGLPEDFKYLVIQESALVSDAVSTSNAVGFWQFKEISGLENDLRIDRIVDERMNIVSSTRAAANYLKSHYAHFNNWAHALIAYQTGLTGAGKVIDESENGARKMKITSETYWYFKKFLAHKVAFQNALGSSQPPFYLLEEDNVKGVQLKDLAKKHNVSIELIDEYNKWLKKGKVPDDKNYTVIIPLKNIPSISARNGHLKPDNESKLPTKIDKHTQQQYPLVDNYPSKSDMSIPHQVTINDLKGIYAPMGFNVANLAETAGIDEYKFRKYNDLGLRENLQSGKIYYLQKKRNRAKFYYHTVKGGESMWLISQKYGLKLKKLYRKNRMEPPEQPKDGRVLWLRQNRPSSIAIEYRQPQIISNERKEYETEKNINPALKEDNPQLIQSNPLGSDSSTVTSKTSMKTVVEVDKINPNVEATLPQKTDSIKQENDTIEISVNSEPSVVVVEEEQITYEHIPSDTTEINLEPNVKEEVVTQEENKDLEDIKDDFNQEDLMQYTIRKGDTFFAIANRFNMRISALLSINELAIRDTLTIGQLIWVNKMDMVEENNFETETKTAQEEEKLNTNNQPKDISYKVMPGDTMYALARKYQVSLKEIMDWNNKDDYTLREGEIILIKQK